MFFYKSSKDAISPTRAHDTDTGWDFYGLDDVTVHPGEVLRVKTGIVIACFSGRGGFVMDKSGRGSLGLKTLGGVIDWPYVGNIDIIVGNINLWNIIKLLALHKDVVQRADFAKAIGESSIFIPRGKSVAQMTFIDILPPADFTELTEEKFKKEFAGRFDDSNRVRGVKGFGSSDNIPELMDQGPGTGSGTGLLDKAYYPNLQAINEGKPIPYQGPPRMKEEDDFVS
jgi:dUTPase